MQKLVKDPAVRNAMQGLADQFPGLLKANDGSDSAELAAAKRGEAAASRPAQAAAQPAALQVSKGTEAVPPEPKPEEPEPAEPAEPAEAAEPGAEVDVVDPLLTGVVNSSTHRKEHARLARRMANVDAAKFPEMSRLWAGNRQDSGFNRNVSKS